MYTTVFYLAGLRLSIVFCILMQAGVQSINISRKNEAATSVLLSYMFIHSLFIRGHHHDGQNGIGMVMMLRQTDSE